MDRHQPSDVRMGLSQAGPVIGRILVIGLGSVHGDDRLGWMVVDRIAESMDCPAEVRRATSPIEILHWMDSATELHIVDACKGGQSAGSIYRMEWPSERLQAFRWNGTHDFPLDATLQLASQLGQRPSKVIVWGIEGASFLEASDPTSQSREWAYQAAVRITREIQRSHRSSSNPLRLRYDAPKVGESIDA